MTPCVIVILLGEQYHNTMCLKSIDEKEILHDLILDGLWCHYNIVNFMLPKVHPWSEVRGAFYELNFLIYVLPQSLQCYMEWHIILYLVIMAPYCIYTNFNHLPMHWRYHSLPLKYWLLFLTLSIVLWHYAVLGSQLRTLNDLQWAHPINNKHKRNWRHWWSTGSVRVRP